MRTIYMDESGYTGYDLLNEQQRFQGASAVQIDEATAASLIAEFFPKLQQPELKHRTLARRKRNWPSLLNIQRTLIKEYSAYTYVCDKRFLLILMFLNSCLEPAFYERGEDFYADGFNYGLASLLFYTAPSFWGQENFDDLLHLFQHAQRTKSSVAIQALVQKAKGLVGKELSEYLLPLANEEKSCLGEVGHPKTNTDAAYIVALSLISHIEKTIDCPYRVVHDRSENLKSYDKTFKKLADETESAEFYETKITRLKFPLQLSGVEQVDSRHSPGVQLADALVGGIIECTKSLVGLVPKNDYNQAVYQLYPDGALIHLLPTMDFEENRRFREGTQGTELIEFFARKFG